MGITYLDNLLTKEDKRQMSRQIRAQISYSQESCVRNPFMEDKEYFPLESALEIERRSDEYLAQVISQIR